MLFQVKNLVVRYEGAEILKGISLEMEEGEIITLIGNNGAGKTTALRAISGLKSPHSGEILFRGQRIDNLLPQDIVKRGISQVPEGRALFPHMSVSENIRISGFLRNDKQGIKEDLDRIYDSFPVLKERSAQRASTLSGGEQQMLAIAMALMARPTLLLLDEPSTGLSPKMVTEIGRVIYNIHKSGTSVLLVEQNANLALSLAQRGYAIETGKIVLSGFAGELKKSEHVKRAYLGQ
ncbi:MAG: ABC transporter ATP-binding protein [Desulfobacteraceae bacterium]|nr:ABC transporter ATP-binding protein [Desulfobacteraceae bacterium]